METMRIMLCCGAGMSSGFLANNVRKAVKRKLNATVEARSYSEVGEYMTTIDILLLGPHYATELNNFQSKAEPFGVKVAVIPKNIYSTLDGEKLLDYILQL